MRRKLEVLITAEEAFPALERCFLNAREEISAGFRVFDPATRLRSDEARAVGQTWFDLIVHTLKSGVRVRFVLSDFDPIGAPDLHESTWHSIRMFTAAREIAGAGADLAVIPGMHPARAGLIPRLAFAPKVFSKLKEQLDDLNALDRKVRDNRLRDMPGLCRVIDERDGKLVPRWFSLPPLYPVTHHQKLAVFDRSKLFIGGLDVDERRYDSKAHDRPAERTWHDVQLLIEDAELASRAALHLETFGQVVAGDRECLDADAHFLTTLSAKRRWNIAHLSPNPLRTDLSDRQRDLIDATRHLLYFETQFFRDAKLAHHMAKAARRNPDLRLLLILPAAPEDVAFENSDGLDAKFGEHLQAKCIRILEKAFGDRMFIGSPVQPIEKQTSDRDTLARAPLVYVHAKVSIFDDDRAVVSSANLNGRSMNWDTEAGVFLDAEGDVAELRKRVFCHWLPPDAGDAFFDLSTAFDAWVNLAQSNAKAAPENRRGFIVPYNVASAEEFGTPVPVLPDEMV